MPWTWTTVSAPARSVSRRARPAPCSALRSRQAPRRSTAPGNPPGRGVRMGPRPTRGPPDRGHRRRWAGPHTRQGRAPREPARTPPCRHDGVGSLGAPRMVVLVWGGAHCGGHAYADGATAPHRCERPTPGIAQPFPSGGQSGGTEDPPRSGRLGVSGRAGVRQGLGADAAAPRSGRTRQPAVAAGAAARARRGPAYDEGRDSLPAGPALVGASLAKRIRPRRPCPPTGCGCGSGPRGYPAPSSSPTSPS